MEIAYCSLLLPEEKKLAERAKERLTGISLHKFSRAVIQGLDANLSKPVKVFNIINTLNYPKFPTLLFPTEQWHHVPNSDDWHIGYINLFGIKYITQSRHLYRKLKQWLKQTDDPECMVFVHHIYYPTMKAACKLKRKYPARVKLCFITGDMNGKYGLAPYTKPSLKERLTKNIEKEIDGMVKCFDCFVFATKYMAAAFGVADYPFTVLECAYAEQEPLSANELSDTVQNDDSLKIIFYAGGLRDEYGIGHLLRAFMMIDSPNYRLWLAGGGTAEPIYKEYAAKDARVEFLGFIPPREVDRRQKLATALISPRTTEYNFVKYSFPSKTLECLASGKPYIAHRLPCDPPEYAGYIQYAENESDESLKAKIIQVCELPREQREEIGNRARAFIEREKNPKAMCKRIVDMLEDVVQDPNK